MRSIAAALAMPCSGVLAVSATARTAQLKRPFSLEDGVFYDLAGLASGRFRSLLAHPGCVNGFILCLYLERESARLRPKVIQS